MHTTRPETRTASAPPLAFDQLLREYMSEFSTADYEALLAKCYDQIASIRIHAPRWHACSNRHLRLRLSV